MTQDRSKHGASELDDDRIVAALADWPPQDPEAVRLSGSSTTWDQAAKQVTTRLAGKVPARSISRLTDDALLAAPLAAEPGEGKMTTGRQSAPPNQKSTVSDVPARRPESIPPPSSGIVRESQKMTTQSEQRQRERTSFKDLARLAATPEVPPVSSAWGMPDAGPSSQAGRLDPNDSGMVDLKMIATLDPRGAERAKTTQLAASGLFDEEPPPVSQPPLSGRVSAPPPSMGGLGRASIPSERPPMVVQASAQESAPLHISQPPASLSHAPAPISARAMMGSSPVLQKKKGSGGILLVLGGVVSLAAAAAGGVFYMKTHAPKPVETAVVVAPPPVVTAPVAPVATETAAVASNDTPPVDSVVDPAANEPKIALKGGTAKHSAGSKAVAAAKPEAPAATTTAAAKKPDTKTAAAPTSTTELGKAMSQAAGPPDAVQAEEKPTGPQFAAGTVPQKPANGTVMGAIGAVLPNARACLGPDDPVSRATITFQSTGTVQSVAVSGGAAGKPAEACIKTALSKAKVPPFAETTFTTAITVRP